MASLPSFDVHQHLWPQELVAALARRRERPRLRGGVLELREGSFPASLRDHDLDRRLSLLDRDGIDVAVVSLAPTLECEGVPELVAAYHEGIVDLVAAAGGRLRALAAGEARPGFAGASVSAGAVLAGLGDLPNELERAGGVLFVHPGPPPPPPGGAPPWWTAVVDYTAQMQAAYARWLACEAALHPGLPVVFAVLAGGAPVQLERLAARGGDAAPPPGVFFDTASYGERALGLALAACGSERLLYGSDTPVVDSRPTLAALAALGGDVLVAASRRNPGRLFG